MKLGLLGGAGQVGQEIGLRAGASGLEFDAPDIDALDITDLDAVSDWAAASGAEIFVNCAAYTAVDQAESDAPAAAVVNDTGAGNVARAAAALGKPVIYLSTDYVFGGAKGAPYTEADSPDPLNVYGATKLAGELATLRHGYNPLVLRVSWVFGRFGHNFVKTILRICAERGHADVVDDQVSAPCGAGALAALILRLVAESTGEPYRQHTYHLQSGAYVSWYEFARRIVREAQAAGLLPDSASIAPIGSHAYPQAAARPRDSRLCGARFTEDFGFGLDPWEAELRDVMLYLQGTRT